VSYTIVGSNTEETVPSFHIYTPGEPCRLKTYLHSLGLPAISRTSVRDRREIKAQGDGCLLTIVSVSQLAAYVNHTLRRGEFTTGNYLVHVMLNNGYVMPINSNDLEPL
jgi:hypothetical protein